MSRYDIYYRLNSYRSLSVCQTVFSSTAHWNADPLPLPFTIGIDSISRTYLSRLIHMIEYTGEGGGGGGMGRKKIVGPREGVLD